MAVVECPFCLSKNNKKIIHTDSISPKDSIYSKMCNVNRLERNEAIMGITNVHISVDYDGTFVRRRSYDRFCLDCNKPFYLISNLIISDIKFLTFIIETKKDRWKYTLCFDRNNSYYNVDHNYITKIQLASLTPARKYKIQNSIKTSNFIKWEAQSGKEKDEYKIKWSVYLEFYNGETLRKGGIDNYPPEWEIFIDSFIRVFKNDIFKMMK